MTALLSQGLKTLPALVILQRDCHSEREHLLLSPLSKHPLFNLLFQPALPCDLLLLVMLCNVNVTSLPTKGAHAPLAFY